MIVYTNGMHAGVDPDRNDVGVSPAFNVNLSSVLFASQLPNTNADTDTGNEYTLTLLDTQMTIQQGSGDITRVGIPLRFRIP